MEESKEFTIDNLRVKIFEDRNTMGMRAARDVASRMEELLKKKDQINMIFAAAPSQNEFLAALSLQQQVNWERVNAFHMDEYVGLDANHPQRFSNFLKDRIFAKVKFNKVYYLVPDEKAPEKGCSSYTKLLRQFPADIVCMGIGENTHIAFNDPSVANFNDPEWVKLVQLDEVSRLQQVHDGCFDDIEDVPKTAITLTVPALMNSKYIYCVVPGKNKAEAVYHTINDEISKKHPSTSLRNHQNAILYLDKDSSIELLKNKSYV